MISRSTLYSSPGGDTVQIEETANGLRNINVKVDIKLSNEENIRYSDYDLLHFFNMIRPNDIMGHIINNDIPFVLSTIFVDFTEYDKNFRKGMLGFVSKFLSYDFIEYLKVIARYIKNGEGIGHYSYLFLGHRKSVEKVLKKSALLLPNSESEYKRLSYSYGIKNNYIKIPNAININKFNYLENVNTNREGVICVGRIEGRKNQLNLIRAVNLTDLKLVIIGNPSPNTIAYYNQCKKEAGKNIRFISHLAQEQLNKYYNSAKVHILPSWFETTGLSSLEAGYLGCNLVVTDKGDVREYFGDYAIYCNPQNIKSIKDALKLAYEKENNNDFKEHVLKNYTWALTAQKTKAAYLKVLNHKNEFKNKILFG